MKRTEEEMARPHAIIIMAAEGCPFAQLGLSASATQEEVLRNWRRRMRDVHPDKTQGALGSTARAAALNESKERALARLQQQRPLFASESVDGKRKRRAGSTHADDADAAEAAAAAAAAHAAEEDAARRKAAANARTTTGLHHTAEGRQEARRREEECRWRAAQERAREARRSVHKEEAARAREKRETEAQAKAKALVDRQMARWRQWFGAGGGRK